MIVTWPNVSGTCVRDARMEDVPRVEAERRTDHHRHRHAIEDEAGHELGKPAWQQSGAQLLARGEVRKRDMTAHAVHHVGAVD